MENGWFMLLNIINRIYRILYLNLIVVNFNFNNVFLIRNFDVFIYVNVLE